MFTYRIAQLWHVVCKMSVKSQMAKKVLFPIEIGTLFPIISLKRAEFLVFFEGTTAGGIHLNDEKFGMLYGNHLRAKGCYTDTRRSKEFYTETIYTLLGCAVVS